MSSNNELKNVVKEKYGKIADSSGCGCGCGSPEPVEFENIQDDYSGVNGYVSEADLGLGCGIPTEFAGIKTGDVVVDLGSGAGNDVFVASSMVGESGRVIGIDMTKEMIIKADRNKEKTGRKNVEFKFGDIESLPIESETADVVLSNCVLNLVPDKVKAFKEIYRILKPGAHFCISDIVIKGEMTPELKKSAELYAGCVSGALQQDDYIKIINEAGFSNVQIQKSRSVELPDDLLRKYLSQNGVQEFKQNIKGIFSITLIGYKSN